MITETAEVAVAVAEGAVEGAAVVVETATTVVEAAAETGMLKPILIGVAVVTAIAGIGYGAWKSRNWVKGKLAARKAAKEAAKSTTTVEAEVVA